MRPRLIALLFLLFNSLHANAACKGSDMQGLVSHYDGTIGKFRVRMTLEFAGDTVTGIYFYASQLKDINIRGAIVDGSKLVLDEMDSVNRVTARFDGTFPTSDPKHRFGGDLQCEVITGRWHEAGSKRELPFYLALADQGGGDLHHQYSGTGVSDDVINQAVRQFWDAVKQGDRKEVASDFDYPITVGKNTKCRKTIHNAAEMLENYDRILSPLRDKILRDPPRALFVHDGLVMLAGGSVWFGPDGNVVALNTLCP